MSRILTVISQRGYPGAGDIDDCWVISTLWAYRAATGDTHLPTVTDFRAAAHNPDRPGATGGDLDDIMDACAKLWPGKATRYSTYAWQPLVAAIEAGNTASLAVLSSKLPANLRFGFYGPHQLGIAWENGHLVAANPLAPDGSAPIPISSAALQRAAAAVKNGAILAAIFEAQPMLNFHLILGPDGTPITGTVRVTTAGHSYLRLVDGLLVSAGVGMTKAAVQVRLTEDCPGKPSHAGQDRRTGWLVGDLAAFLLGTAVTFTPEPGDTAAAHKAGFAEAKARAIAAAEGI